jgi:hypothetical protein
MISPEELKRGEELWERNRDCRCIKGCACRSAWVRWASWNGLVLIRAIRELSA